MTPVDQYIYAQPDNIKEILDFLNEEIVSLDSGIKCSLKWRVPYYTKKRSLCYLNVLKGDEVEINFTQAIHFGAHVKQSLNFRNRSTVGGITYNNLKNIDVTILHQVLHEALLIDGV